MGSSTSRNAHGRTRRRRIAGALAPLLLLALVAAAVPPPALAGAPAAIAASPSGLSVVVRELLPGSDRAEQAVRALGGTVTADLPIVGGFAATVPAGRIDALRAVQHDTSRASDPSAPPCPEYTE